jgi:hypothetical protein
LGGLSSWLYVARAIFKAGAGIKKHIVLEKLTEQKN